MHFDQDNISLLGIFVFILVFKANVTSVYLYENTLDTEVIPHLQILP